jgi:hypothetical protein
MTNKLRDMHDPNRLDRLRAIADVHRQDDDYAQLPNAPAWIDRALTVLVFAAIAGAVAFVGYVMMGGGS